MSKRLRLVISNAFSVNMLEKDEKLSFKKINDKGAKKLVKRCIKRGIEILSIVGHESTAKVLSEILGVEIKANRIVYKMKEGDVILATVISFRPEEGKIYDENSLKDLYNKGKVSFWVIFHEELIDIVSEFLG